MARQIKAIIITPVARIAVGKRGTKPVSRYVKNKGGIGDYYPDFTIKLNDGSMWVVETKGPEDIDDPRKIERLKIWCEDVTEATGRIWDYLYVKQEVWKTLVEVPNTFKEIINIFKS